MKALLRKILFKLYYLVYRIYIPVLFSSAQKRGQLKHLSAEELRVWKNAMLNMLHEYSRAAYNYRMHHIIKAFACSKFEIIRKTDAPDSRSPIVILCVKNDLARLKMLVRHYRAAGVEKFAILDNNSTDGTFEWMTEQPDIDVYRTTEKYQTAVKEGWINRLVSYYGLNRWYIPTDSDELAVWIGMEKHDVRELVAYAERNGFQRLKALTLDTYTDKELFSKSDDIRRDYRFVDSDSYFEKEVRAGTHTIRQFFGGPRNRLMGITVPLSKYPLSYFSDGTISVSAHFLYPHELNNDVPCCLGILHYKFIDKDLQEFRKRAASNSGFSSNGLHYKKMLDYLGDGEKVSFMYDGTVEFLDSSALKKIDFIREIVF